MGKSYKIEIEVSNAGGVYSADSIEEASEIADKLCNEIYSRLRGKCTVMVKNVTEVN